MMAENEPTVLVADSLIETGRRRGADKKWPTKKPLAAVAAIRTGQRK